MAKKKTYLIQDSIDPDASRDFSVDVPRDGVVEKVVIRTYLGQREYLRYRPYVVTEQGTEIPLVSIAGGPRDDIGGNDSVYHLHTRVPVSQGDEIHVQVENLTSQYSYTADAQVDVDYSDDPDTVDVDVIQRDDFDL